MKKESNMGVDSASSTPTFWNKVKTFLFTTLNAMTFGIFGIGINYYWEYNFNDKHHRVFLT